MQIHFFSYAVSAFQPTYTSWIGTENAIGNGEPEIHTTQMGLLSTSLFEKGYRIFVHDCPWESYEIKLGCDNERTDREIKLSHNLFKLWQAGEFNENKGILVDTETKN